MESDPAISTWVTEFQGLSESEVQTRQALQGESLDFYWRGPSFRQILNKNLFTIFNLDLVGLVSLQLFFGKPLDALISFLILSAAILIGVVQEVWAWNRLELFTLTTSPKANVIREGEIREVDPRRIVRGDLLLVGFGDQIFADGEILESDNFEVDQSVISDDMDILSKQTGNQVQAGSFCVNGRAIYRADQAGLVKIDQQLSAQTQAIHPMVYSPLQKLINRLLRMLLLIVAYFSFILILDYLLDSIELINRSSLAGMIFIMAPSSLFFMIIVAYTMGAVRIADRGAIIPMTQSIEYLAQISVLCFSKIGSLTTTRLHIDKLEGDPHPTDQNIQRILGNFARSISSNHIDYQIIQDEFPGEKMMTLEEAPFISAYGWSGVVFNDRDLQGTYILGDPKLLQAYLLDNTKYKSVISPPATSDAGITRMSRRARRLLDRSKRATQERINKLIFSQRTRVLLFAYRPDNVVLHDQDGLPRVPDNLIPLGFLRLSEETRSESLETLEVFADAGVKLKLLSIEEPHLVLDFAEQTGMIRGENAENKVISGHDLAAMDRAQFRSTVVQGEIFGNLTPELKQEIIQTLRSLGEKVAMVGESFHDLIAMRSADLGITMHREKSAIQGVADIHLLDNSLVTLFKLFQEGQSVVNGLLDALKLYLARIIYVVVLIISIGLLGLGFPYTGKLATIIGLVTVDIPAIVVAVTARPGIQPRGGLSRQLFIFAIPAGLLTGLAGFVVYLFFFSTTQDIFYAQLTLTYTLIGCGALLILFVEPPFQVFAVVNEFRGNRWPAIIEIVLVLIFLIFTFTDIGKRLFDIQPLQNPLDYFLVGAVILLWGLILRFTWRHRFFERYMHME